MLITVVTKGKRGVGKNTAESERSGCALVSEPRGMFQSSPESVHSFCDVILNRLAPSLTCLLNFIYQISLKCRNQ